MMLPIGVQNNSEFHPPALTQRDQILPFRYENNDTVHPLRGKYGALPKKVTYLMTRGS